MVSFEEEDSVGFHRRGVFLGVVVVVVEGLDVVDDLKEKKVRTPVMRRVRVVEFVIVLCV